MSSSEFPRETTEFAAVTVTVDGAAVTTGVTFAVVASGARPVTFVAPTTLSGRIGVMVSTMTVGTYDVWAKVVSSPETPVINCGSFRVS